MVFLFLASALFWTITARAAEEVNGKTFYTTANIWYEQPDRIDSTNYHYGTILPIGTKVKITEVNDTTPVISTMDSEMSDLFIRFADETGKSYKIIFMSRHARPGMSVLDYFKQYFSENDPMAEGGSFKSLTADEQKKVKAGEIASGMSKKAVIMAYGYPPGHRTPSLDLDRWVYWVNYFKTRAVNFMDDKVFEAQRRNMVSSIDECIRACKENTNRTSERCFDDCRPQ
jgi:hypothetical protein